MMRKDKRVGKSDDCWWFRTESGVVHRERACMNGGCIHFDRFCTSVQLRTLFLEYF